MKIPPREPTFDHGAALYFHHSWDGYLDRAAGPFALIKDHALLPFAALRARQRFDWLVASRRASIQTSPVHSGRCTDPRAALEHLMARMVRTPKARNGA